MVSPAIIEKLILDSAVAFAGIVILNEFVAQASKLLKEPVSADTGDVSAALTGTATAPIIREQTRIIQTILFICTTIIPLP